VELLNRWISYWGLGINTGLLVALEVMVAAGICTVIWGLVIAMLRASPVTPLRWLAIAYIEFFRGTPLLVQILIIFAALPKLVGLFLPPFQTAVLALTLNAGSYMAESYRAGLQAVPRGQREAAVALGMSSPLVFWRVVLPQAIRVILPAVGNILISLLLTTPFVFLAGLEDMMAKAIQVLNRTADFSVYVLVTLIYVVLGLLLVWGNSRLERKLRLPGMTLAR
jgi:His/Glu/Gln/Arg/opine family amino acid ABC transporter permease subunit